MLVIYIGLVLNDKAHLPLLIEIIKKYNIDNPVYIVELDNCISINLESDYEQYELIKDFAEQFPEYEITDNIDSGQEDVLLIINRNQSAFSTDGWGRRWNEDDINSTTYLVKKKEKKATRPPNPIFKVMFGEELREYKAHIAPGRNTETGKEGFIVLEEDPKVHPDTKIISGLIKDKTQAFWEAYRLKQPQIEEEYAEYKAIQKKKSRSRKNTGKKKENGD